MCTGVQKFPLDISAMLSPENFEPSHWAKQIVSDFKKQLERIRQKYRNAGCPLKFTNQTICSFERG